MAELVFKCDLIMFGEVGMSFVEVRLSSFPTIFSCFVLDSVSRVLHATMRMGAQIIEPAQ